jgi:hypothetical protein
MIDLPPFPEFEMSAELIKGGPHNQYDRIRSEAVTRLAAVTDALHRRPVDPNYSDVHYVSSINDALERVVVVADRREEG